MACCLITKHYLRLMIMVLTYYTGKSECSPEVIDAILCLSGSEINITCDDNSFIDMLPGGDYDTPEAMFILEGTCPENRNDAMENALQNCRVKYPDLLSGCHGQRHCTLNPSQANRTLSPDSGCPAVYTNLVVFSFRCFHIRDGLNLAMMSSPDESRPSMLQFTAQTGHIFSPEFPNSVPSKSQTQTTDCSLTFKNKSTIALTMHQLYFQQSDEHYCSERLELAIDGVSKKNICDSKLQNKYLVLNVTHELTITYVKCTGNGGGKFWMSFLATRQAEVKCSDSNTQTKLRQCYMVDPDVTSYTSVQNTNQVTSDSNVQNLAEVIAQHTTQSLDSGESKTSQNVIIGSSVGATCMALFIFIFLAACFVKNRKKKEENSPCDENEYETVTIPEGHEPSDPDDSRPGNDGIVNSNSGDYESLPQRNETNPVYTELTQNHENPVYNDIT